MTKPIKPSEIAKAKASAFPDFVFVAINELLAAKFTDGRAVIKQKDIRKKIYELAPEEYQGTNIFELGWLNFEEVYREAGWHVVYDKPAYNENYDANFTFKVKN